jgi:hypothetical protein
MDQLDLLKKDWKKQESSLPKLSYDELTKLIHKKSSSIVKWIFIISLLEFLLPHIIYLFMDSDEINAEMNSMNLKNLNTIFSIIFYAVVLVFIYFFYKNYKSISANSNPKVLMQNIIKTRKTVKYYIWFTLSMIPIVGITLFYKAIYSSEFSASVPKDTNLIMVWLVALISLALLVLVFWLFYKLVYGILLNKLKGNYNELVSNGNGDL